MLRAILSLLFCVHSLLLHKLPQGSQTNSAIWAKKGTSFPVGCADDFSTCRPLTISSPDGKNAVEVTYDTAPDYPKTVTVSLKIATYEKCVGMVSALTGVDDEITWSPDSRCFFINSNYNDYADKIVSVHCLDEPKFGPGHITQQAERDMVRSFPPCRATYTLDNCAQMAADPDSYLGVVGLDWINGSSEIVVMAEVPCSSSMGGIMCQVLGYEIAVPSGKILRRMEPKEFAKRWQHSMAWKFRIPDPPEYKKK